MLNLFEHISDFFLIVPLFLISNCFILFLYKKFIGPKGLFYLSIITSSLSIILLIIEVLSNIYFNSYFFIDLGYFIYIKDIIESKFLFCIDPLGASTSALVILLTMFAQFFGVEYMAREAFLDRLLILLNMFASSVVMLFLSYDFLLILISWELIGLFSFLLVNFYSQRIYTVKAALKTFIFSRISDMFIFTAFIITLLVFSTTDLSILFVKIPFYSCHMLFIGNIGFHLLTVLSLCIAIAGCIKGAQLFSHVWLPDAMEAPTPASALIHSSTLVVMGVFTIIRFSVLFEFCPFTNYLLSLWGSCTIAFGAVVGFFQNDIKKLVAYSTISQMGYLVCGCGFTAYEEVIFYLMVHAVNKAFLFVIVGYTVHYFNSNTDLRQMSTIYLYSLDISIFFLLTCFNLMGLPYTAGFYSKEFLLFQVLRFDVLGLVVRSMWFISFIFTPLYMLKLVISVSFDFKKSILDFYKVNLPNQIFWVDYLLCNLKIVNIIKYQISCITSKTTSIVLFTFWILFMFFGEHILLIIFNFNGSGNFINSNFFLSYKNHFSFSSVNLNSFLAECIMWTVYVMVINTSIFLAILTNKSSTAVLDIILRFDLLLAEFFLLSIFI